jgi:hypothetical protein
MPLCAARYLRLTALLLLPAMARADQPDTHVDLACDAAANLALVRFAVSAEPRPVFPRLPAALDHGLSASTGARRTDCTLADGTTIRVRGGREQAFAHGMGGANPPAFFSLWINQRKVFSRKTWMPGYAESANNPAIYDGVLIAPARMTICSTADGKPQRCTGAPLDLAKAPVDSVEFDTSKPKVLPGQFTVIAKGTANQQFCAAYLSALKPGIDDAVRGNPTSFDTPLPPRVEPANPDAARTHFGPVALLPGVARSMVAWSEDSHYFDGAVIALAPPGMALAALEAAYPYKDIENWPARVPPANVTLISGGQKQLYPGVSPRYVHLVPQRIDGSLYVLAYPTNNRVRPTAALVKPRPDGGFATVCAFNRAEARF